MATKVYYLTNYSYSTKVVGESNYQDNIKTVIGFIDEGDQQVKEDELEASLILEDDNEYDRGNAVRVDMDGYTVGYLTRDDAKAYRRSLDQLRLTDAVGICKAVVNGKWNDEVETLVFGVLLDLDPNRLSVLRKTQEVESPVKTASTPAAVLAPNAVIAPAAVPAPQAVKASKRKIPFIPIKGTGCLYFLLVLPFVLVINLYILLFAGIWYGSQWLWKTATATPNRRRASGIAAGATLLIGSVYSAVSSFSSPNVETAPTLDLVSVQGTALAEAWLSYTQTSMASITDTPIPTATLMPTDTPVILASPVPPTPTLVIFPTATYFFQALPANQPTPTFSNAGACSCSGDTLNCSNFSSWSSAQACYTYCINQGAGDIHRLDGNNDGSACDSLK